MENVYDNTFLNSLFTSDEFDFINNIYSDTELFDRLSKKQQQNRDLIVKFINNLNDSKDSSEKANLMEQAKKVFEITNKNISVLQTNKELSDNINKEIMNLLIKVESDKNNFSESKYINEVLNLKTDLSYYSSKSENMKNFIISNDNIINDFFSNASVEKYLNNFSLNYNKEEKKATIKSIPVENIVVGNVKEDNNCLLVSEKSKRVYLPYSKKEVLEYLEKYPTDYKSFEDVVKKEFIYPIDFYSKHPVVSRFRETYTLVRDREAKSIVDAFKVAMDVMFRYDLNPAIIAACKSQEQLENYLNCLNNKTLSEFKDFEIKFEVSPLKVNK